MTTPTQPGYPRRGCSPWTLLGCGCGMVGLIGILLVFFMLFIIHARSRKYPIWNEQDFITCQQNLHYLGKSLDSYARDHNNRLPATLDDLLPRYLDDKSRLRCPLERKGLGSPYQYSPTAKNPLDPVITCDNHGQNRLTLRRSGQLQIIVRHQRKLK